MPKFSCGFCESNIRVPDEYVGKRVKCPGCGKAVVVPGEVPDSVGGGGGLDLSLLDDSMSGGESAAKPRKLRSIVVGCGVCSKTVHIPENRRGAVTPCPKCKTPLLVDVPELPDTSGATIDFKHLVLDPASEPSLMGDSIAGGSAGSLTSTGTRLGRSRKGGTVGGSRVGNTGSFAASSMGSMGPASNAQDQMSELRSLNDLKASGSISDDEYRRRKASIYSGGGGGGGDSAMARKATSRSAGGASERAIRVSSAASIPGPLKLVIAVAVLAFAGFAVWEFGIKPALRDIDASTTFDSEREADRDPRTAEQIAADLEAEREAAALAAAEAAAAEPEVTWTSLVPDLGPDALEVAMVIPGKAGPAPEASIFDMDDEDAVAGGDTPDTGSGTLSAAAPVRDARPGVPGTIVMWDIFYPDTSSRNPLSRLSAFTRRFESGTDDAIIGVGAGPAVTGLDDRAFVRWEKVEIQQRLVNGLDGVMDFGSAKPNIVEREQTIDGFTFREMTIEGRGADRGKRIALLTGVQDGYAVHYWFDGPGRLYRIWKREAVGKAMLE